MTHRQPSAYTRVVSIFRIESEEQSMKSPDMLLNPREAAAAIGVSYPTIKQWILTGKLKTIKTAGGHHRIPQAALKRYLPAPAKPPGTSSRERFRQTSGR